MENMASIRKSQYQWFVEPRRCSIEIALMACKLMRQPLGLSILIWPSEYYVTWFDKLNMMLNCDCFVSISLTLSCSWLRNLNPSSNENVVFSWTSYRIILSSTNDGG